MMGRNGNGGVLIEKAENNEEARDGPSTSQFHVLAVDDSIVDRKVIERLLRSSAYKVTTVDSGRRALEFLGLDEQQSSVNIENIKVNMIITDYCMPGMTGYDLLKKIKGSSALREIPVVIMSSENVMARINRCLEEGAEEFILKPVKLSDVKRLKGHIVKCLSKDQEQRHLVRKATPAEQEIPLQSSKRKSIAEDLDISSQQSSKRRAMSDDHDLPSPSSERRPRIGELSVA